MILGITASHGAGARSGDFQLIETVLLTGNQASVTFSNLGNYSSNYKHLQIRAVTRGTENFDIYGWTLRFNSDTGNNYARHVLYGNGSAAGSDGSSSVSSMTAGYIPGSQATANNFSAQMIDILDAYNTNKYKTVRMSAAVLSSSSEIDLASGLWMNTNAISSITLGGSYATNSRFSLYGIKG